MARTIAQIKTQMDQQQALESALAGLNSPSQTAIYSLWKYVMSTAIWLQESLWDLFNTQLDVKIASSPAWTDAFIQSETFKFQYDSVTPQILSLDSNFVPSYANIDESKRIISRCSVITKPQRVVSVKVATGTPPQKLTTGQTISLQGYLDVISPAGVQYQTISYNPDQLLIGAIIYYEGQYQSVIQTNVINGINDYMTNIEFDGYIRLSALEDAIQAVQGVTDIVLTNVAIRADSTPFGQQVYLLKNNTEIFNKYSMFAGYVISETTAGSTLNDLLQFVVE